MSGLYEESKYYTVSVFVNCYFTINCYETRSFTIIIALALTGWIGMARLVRAQVLSLKQREFVIAAERLGTSHMKIIYGHLIPNLTGIIIVNLSFTIPAAIFSESFLSFIGLGCNHRQQAGDDDE